MEADKNRQKKSRAMVALVPCLGYGEDVAGKLRMAVDLIGGMKSFIGKDEKILVKPNLLMGAAPEKAATTHPTVLGATLSCLKEHKYNYIEYGDSPGVGSVGLEVALKKSGLSGEAEKYGVSLGDFTHSETVKYPEGKVGKRFSLCKAVTNADAIISISKMKTHALENITGAVKNQYGCIMGLNKGVGHARYPDSFTFAKMLVDLNMYLKPRLYIMDGIVAMEGNGPSSGTPIAMNVILASADPVALDTVFACLVNLKPSNVPTCVYGERFGLGVASTDRITVVTPDGELTCEEAFEKYGKSDFKVKRKKPVFWNLKVLLPFSKRRKERPVVDASLCTGCGICEKACPVEGKAVHSGGGKKAVYDYKKCIRCYCCQEMCPKGAISRKG